MKQILTAMQMRQADQATIDGGVSAFDLMQRAGRAVADTAQKVAPDTGRMVIVVGGGNNGGDGYAAATTLSGMKGACDGGGLERSRKADRCGGRTCAAGCPIRGEDPNGMQK